MNILSVLKQFCYVWSYAHVAKVETCYISIEKKHTYTQ